MGSPSLASRRSFLELSGASVLTAWMASAQQLSATTPDWFNRPMRWAQLAFVEDDPGKYDRDFWLDYFARTHSQGACLSAGGCVAFYPTRIPFHHRSAFMQDTDPFGDLLAGCRKLGMVVVARTDPHAITSEAAQAHPEWVHLTADGKPRPHWATPGRWVTCALGPYNFDFMTEVHREIMSLYQVDGIFINRWSGHGRCYCEACRANFRAASNHDIPRTEDPRDPAVRAYILWRQQRLFDLWQLWDAEARKINPNSRVVPNAGGGALSELDMKQIGERTELLAVDRQARRGLAPPWTNGMSAKEYRATLGNKPVLGIFSVGVEEPYRWKDSVQSEAEIRIWAADGIANGMRPWFTKFAAHLYDKRWLRVVEDIYQWHHRHEKYFRNEASLARVAMVYSQQSAWFYGGRDARRKLEDPSLGFYQALIEARIPFDMVHDGLLDAEHLAPYRVLILPNIAALSDQQCAQLRAFTARGGGIVATLETSLYDQWGERRKNFGLADLFGVDYAAHAPRPMQNAYLRIQPQADGAYHPLVSGLADAYRIIHGTERLEVTERERFALRPLTLIPSYPDLPMEEVYPRVQQTDILELYARPAGQGRIVYFPFDLDRTYWEVLNPDHFRLIRNAVLWAANEPPMLSVTGQGLFDVTAWRQSDSLTIHLVNLTNPMAMKGPYRELIPSPPQKVSLRLPPGRRARQVRLLRSASQPRANITADRVELNLPSVLDHEVIAIDLA